MLHAGQAPAPKAHALLLALALSPLLVHLPYSASIVLHAALAVYVGAWRSVKPEPPQESMSDGDAYRFPLVGSCVLFGLFLCFKFLPKSLVNALLAAYVVSLGAFVVVSTVLPFCEPLFPPALRDRVVALPTIPAIPFLGFPEPTVLEPTVPELVLAGPSIALGTWYFVTKSWLANNLLGLAFSLVGIEALSLGSTRTGAILLAGLFVYDVFWVFCTPVMVSVARNFEAPIKLLFPRISLGAIRKATAAAAKAAAAKAGAAAPASAASHFAMLGLGDIVIPGLFVALMLRHDVERRFASSYFPTAFWAYVGGVATTIVVMNVFKAAQPALLYIVPSVLGALAAHSALKGEFWALFRWKEAHVLAEEREAAEEEARAAKEAAKAGGKGGGGGSSSKKTK
jgi:minor histocompatibility antigen H13